MTLKSHYVLCFKTRASFGAHCGNLNDSDKEPMTLVSANIRLVPIFEEVHWRKGVKRQWGNRKHGFSRLSTLRLQHFKKWDERYYIPCRPCRLSTDPLGDFEWLECSLYVTVLRFAILPLVIFFLLIYCRVCLRSGTARDPHRSAGSGV